MNNKKAKALRRVAKSEWSLFNEPDTDERFLYKVLKKMSPQLKFQKDGLMTLKGKGG